MKKQMRNLRQNTVIYLANILCFSFGILFYRRLIGIYATLFTAAILLFYAICMALCQYAQNKYHKYEKDGCLTKMRQLYLALAICCPIYWCWIIVGMIPIISYHAWLITGLPLHLIGWIPLKKASSLVQLKFAFWCIQIALYPLLFFICQSILHVLLTP